MPAPNLSPIYSKVGDTTSSGVLASTAGMAPVLTTAAADYDGTSANNAVAFTAKAGEGSYLQRLRCKAKGNNAASVLRVFINNGADHTVSTNNSFYGELSLPATTAITTAATIELDYPLNFALPPGFKIYVGLGATVVAGWVVTAIGGQY